MATSKREKPGHRQRMAYLRGLLLERRRKLLEDLEIDRKARGRRGGDETWDPADIATDSSNEDLALRISEMESSEVLRIEGALRKIKEGTYGVCEECGGRIPAPRLKVMPTASFCVACQEKFEISGERPENPGIWREISDGISDDPPEISTVRIVKNGAA